MLFSAGREANASVHAGRSACLGWEKEKKGFAEKAWREEKEMVKG